MRFAAADGTQRCARTGCSKTFIPAKNSPKSGPSKRLYCSDTCKQMTYKFRKGLRQPRAFGMCKNRLHDRSPENSFIDKKGTVRCLLCHRKTQTRRNATKRAVRAQLKAAA